MAYGEAMSWEDYKNHRGGEGTDPATDEQLFYVRSLLRDLAHNERSMVVRNRLNDRLRRWDAFPGAGPRPNRNDIRAAIATLSMYAEQSIISDHPARVPSSEEEHLRTLGEAGERYLDIA